MTQLTPRLRRLLREAEQAARANKRAAATQLYEDILAQEPDLPEAWLGLAPLLFEDEAQTAAYERVLALDSSNKQAQRGLAVLRGELPAEAEPETVADHDEPSGLPQADLSGVDAGRSWEATPTVAERFDAVVVDAPVKAADKANRPVADASPVPAAAPVTATRCCSRGPEGGSGLRCIRCGKPICMHCSDRTPVGYMCHNCIREAEDNFFSARLVDYLLAGLVAVPLGIGAAFLMSLASGSFLGFFAIIFLGPAAGTLISRIVFRLIGRRRGRYLPHIVATGIALPAGLLALALLLAGGGLGAILMGVYLAVATSAAYYQLR